MNLIEFFTEIFSPNVELYFLCLFLLVFPTYIIYKKLESTIIDPLVFQLLMALFANVIPVFLIMTGYCSKELFMYFVLAETIFWLGVIRFSRNKSHFQEKAFQNENRIEYYLFVYFFLIYAFFKVLTYVKFGIPAFMENRNQVYAGSGGWGILSYITPFLSLYFLIFFMDKFYKKIFKRIYIYCSAFYLVTCLLDGGRGAIVTFFFAYFFYSTFYLGKLPRIKWKYLLIIPLFAIVSISFSMATDGSSILRLGERIVAFGDVYFYAYPNEVINSIKEPNALLHMFMPILRPLRIVSYTAQESLPLGSKILYAMNYQYELAEIMSAPNTRIPIATWIYFKWAGLLVPYFIGYIISFVAFRMRKYFHRTILGVACYSYIYLQAVAGCTDLSMFLGSFFSILVNAFILLFFLILFTGGKMVVRKVNVWRQV